MPTISQDQFYSAYQSVVYGDTKDDREDPLAIPEAAAQPTPSDYRSLLVKHRKTQLQNIRANVRRLAETYDRAAEAILERVRALPDGVERTGTGWLKAQLNLAQQLRMELDRLRDDYGRLLDLSLISSAQDAADREAEIVKLVGAPTDPRLLVTAEKTVTLTTGVTVEVQFGALAKEAVETVANRYYRDGLNLSQRLYNLDQGTRKVIEDKILQGIAAGTSSRDLAIELQEALAAKGVQTPRYNAMRIARTEINNAFREAHTRSVTDPGTGATKSYIQGVKWNLSKSHARTGPDICDVWAAHDEGLGEGVYSPDSVPVDHPHGLCFQTTVLKAMPDVIPTTMTMKPDVAAVPQGQVRYYAEQLGDAPAQALLARST